MIKKTTYGVALAVLFAALPLAASAQSRVAQATPAPAGGVNIANPTPPRTNANDPDVLLQIPNLSVESIDLQVDNLKAGRSSIACCPPWTRPWVPWEVSRTPPSPPAGFFRKP